MDWFMLSLISLTSVSIASLFQRSLMKNQKSDPFAYSLVFQFLSAILIGFVAYWQGFILPPIKDLSFNFIISALCYAGFTIFLFKALKHTEVSKVTILASTRALWTILIALIFLGEEINLIRIIATFMVIGSIVLIFYEKGRINLNRGGIYALIAAFCFGIGFANDTIILKKSDALSYAAISFLLPNFIILLINPKVITKMRAFLTYLVFMKMIIMSLFYSLATVTIYLAYQKGGDVSRLAPISQSSVVLTVILAVMFLKERNNLVKKIISAVLVSIGVILLK